MKTRITLLTAAMTVNCIGYSHTAMSALPTGAILTIEPGVVTTDSYGNTNVVSGSFFGMDLNSDSKIQATEKTALAEGTNGGIIIGRETTAGASHTSGITPSDTNELNAPWEFAGNTGSGQFIPGSNGPTDNNDGTIDWTGFLINWNGTTIDMGTGSTTWQVQNCNILLCTGVTFSPGKADFSWSGVFGDPYTLHYTAIVPSGQFEFTQYYLRYVGIVLAPPNAAPVASDFSVSAAAGSTLLVDVSSNATDSDGNLDATSVVVDSDGSCGTITNNSDGTVTIPACPASSYTFGYTISDTLAASDTGIVSVTISSDPATNTQPDTATTIGTSPVIIDVISNDTGAGTADATTVAVSTAANNGSTSVNATNGEITYTANTGFSGTDVFSYTVDTTTAVPSAAAQVAVTINAGDDPASSSTYSAGTTASAAGSTNGVVTSADIGVTDDAGSADLSVIQQCVGGCFDFVLTGFTGTEASVVLPLSTPVPTVAAGDALSYRKLIGASWQNFESSNNNAIHSANTLAGAGVVCPPPTDPVYNTSTGLTPGHQCIRLTITDNGPNDNDATAGTIADPGGIAVISSVDNRVASTSGCSVTNRQTSIKDHMEWLLVIGFIGLLGFFGRKSKTLS